MEYKILAEKMDMKISEEKIKQNITDYSGINNKKD